MATVRTVTIQGGRSVATLIRFPKFNPLFLRGFTAAEVADIICSHLGEVRMIYAFDHDGFLVARFSDRCHMNGDRLWAAQALVDPPEVAWRILDWLNQWSEADEEDLETCSFFVRAADVAQCPVLYFQPLVEETSGGNDL